MHKIAIHYCIFVHTLVAIFGIYLFREIVKIVWIVIANSHIIYCRREGKKEGKVDVICGLKARGKRVVYVSCPVSDTHIPSTPMSRFLSCRAS